MEKSIEKMIEWHNNCIKGEIPGMTSINMDIPIPDNIKKIMENSGGLEDAIKEALSCVTMKLIMTLVQDGQDEFQNAHNELCKLPKGAEQRPTFVN